MITQLFIGTKHGRIRLGRIALSMVACAATLSGAEAATKTGIPSLEHAAAIISALPAASAASTIAAHISSEGHWTLVNRTGEAFTAATPDELKRGWSILLPEVAAAASKPAIYLTPESVFEHRAKLSTLPRDAALWLTAPAGAIRLVRVGSGTSTQAYAELKPNLLIEIGTAADYREAMLHLDRTLDRSGFRILSLEPGGPKSLASTARIDKATGRAAVDAIDPNHVVSALGALRGQTAVIVGRLDGDTLAIKPASAPERTLRWSELVAAATAADVNVLLIKSTAAQQPGGRNWLWQKVEVKGLDQALTHATLADFLDALGASTNRLVVTAQQTARGRTVLDVHRPQGLPSAQSSTAQVSSRVLDMVSGLAGKVVHEGAVLDMRSASRQIELDRRLFAFLPSMAQWVFGGLLLLGAIGAPVAWRWWSRLWPAEKPSEYANTFGFWAARIVRASAFGAVFLPLVAIAAAPLQLWGLLRRKPATAATPATR